MELPGRLRKSIQLEAYTQAVRYYDVSSGVLKRYEDLPSFRAIKAECEEIIKNLKAKLLEKLKEPIPEADDLQLRGAIKPEGPKTEKPISFKKKKQLLGEYVDLLIRLGEQSTELMKLFQDRYAT